jgi:hypothetical protein
LTKGILDDHFQSNAHLEKLNALLNGFQKSEHANKIVAEKPVQGQAVSLLKLEEPTEETSIRVPVPVPQSDKSEEVTSQDKGNPSSSKPMVISIGHKKVSPLCSLHHNIYLNSCSVLVFSLFLSLLLFF